jgi:uncharacterized NAD-dependent epimerase/dehydratase family protein
VETIVTRRLVILAEGALDYHFGKTAISLIRYRPDEVVAVIDSANAGQKAGHVLGLSSTAPVVSDIEDAIQFGPTELLLGIAPRGGDLPQDWRRQILSAIGHGLHVTSGLHSMLSDDAEFVSAARRRGVRLNDVRRSPESLDVATMRARRPGSHVITFVGSDCAVGKMTAALEMCASAQKSGLNAAFVATGQTGIMLEGSGIAIDRVIGDFMAGATEKLVVDASERADWVFVEGQGSLLHPGYSGVTLALLHGSLPDAMVLVHRAGQVAIDEYDVPIPPLSRVVEIYEEAASWIRAAPVAAIALNTRHLGEEQARQAVEATERSTGLPATDPIRFGAHKLMEAVRTAVVAAPEDRVTSVNQPTFRR